MKEQYNDLKKSDCLQLLMVELDFKSFHQSLFLSMLYEPKEFVVHNAFMLFDTLRSLGILEIKQ